MTHPIRFTIDMFGTIYGQAIKDLAYVVSPHNVNEGEHTCYRHVVCFIRGVVIVLTPPLVNIIGYLFWTVVSERIKNMKMRNALYSNQPEKALQAIQANPIRAQCVLRNNPKRAWEALTCNVLLLVIGDSARGPRILRNLFINILEMLPENRACQKIEELCELLSHIGKQDMIIRAVHAKNSEGKPLIFRVAEMKRYNIVQCFLQYGTDPDVKYGSGSLRQLLVQQGRSDIVGEGNPASMRPERDGADSPHNMNGGGHTMDKRRERNMRDALYSNRIGSIRQAVIADPERAQQTLKTDLERVGQMMRLNRLLVILAELKEGPKLLRELFTETFEMMPKNDGYQEIKWWCEILFDLNKRGTLIRTINTRNSNKKFLTTIALDKKRYDIAQLFWKYGAIRRRYNSRRRDVSCLFSIVEEAR